MSLNVRFRVRAQPVDATQALNFSAGVSNPRVLRGRSLSWRATLLRWACEYTDKSAPFGKYRLSRPFAVSEPAIEPTAGRSCASRQNENPARAEELGGYTTRGRNPKSSMRRRRAAAKWLP